MSRLWSRLFGSKTSTHESSPASQPKTATSRSAEDASLPNSNSLGEPVDRQRNFSKIHEASWNGDLAQVEELLKCNPDLASSIDYEGRQTPLHVLEFGDIEDVARLLLLYKADVNAKDDGGNTPLHAMVGNGDTAIAELLLDNNADVNAMNDYGVTPLHAARNSKTVELLISYKGDVNRTDNSGDTPLHKSAKAGDIDAAASLLANGADPTAKNHEGHTPLESAIAGDWNNGDKRWEKMALLLREHEGGDVEQFETLLMKAYFNENRDGDLEKAKALVNDNPSLVVGKNGNGSTPLHLAASKGLKDLVELLLANEADANAEDGGGDTPLHLAVMAGHRDVAELLLANKARVNVTNDRGKTPLWYVTIGGTVEDVAELLRRHGGRA